jgi:hypothetical protein
MIRALKVVLNWDSRLVSPLPSSLLSPPSLERFANRPAADRGPAREEIELFAFDVRAVLVEPRVTADARSLIRIVTRSSS